MIRVDPCPGNPLLTRGLRGPRPRPPGESAEPRPAQPPIWPRCPIGCLASSGDSDPFHFRGKRDLIRTPPSVPALLLVAGLLAPSPATAQNGGEGSGRVVAIDLDLAPRPSARASRASGPVRIDGVLDDASWASAQVIDEFFQQKPAAGLPATERTEVRILFDDENLYVGAEMHDGSGTTPIIPTLQRDPNTRDGDSFGITLDPFRDGKTVFAFFFNPGGTLRDSQTSDDGRINNAAWDAALDVQTRVHDSGWTLELAIPWSQLRFAATGEEQTWGMNLLRRIRRKNEDATWSPMDRQWQLYVMSRAGTLTGLVGLEPGRNLSVKPFVLASDPSGELQAGVERNYDGGVDLKYGLTPGLTLDLTVNTDFSQVEVDQEQVNLTRFSLFFPEKREFFLENAGVFQFGDQGTYSTRTGVTNRDFTLFHSRRIGLTPGGNPLPILGGGRVSGTSGPITLGVLNMQTRGEGTFAAENFSVARLRGEPTSGFTVGGIFVNRAATGSGVGDNQSYGVDADLQAFNGYLLVQSYLAATQGTASDGSTIDRGLAGRLSVGWRDPFWEIFALYRRLDDDFAPGAGFVLRTGVEHTYGTIGVRPRVDWPGMLEVNPYVEAHRYVDIGGALQTREATGGLAIDFTDGSTGTITVTDYFERVSTAFSVRGAQVDVGAYDFRDVSANYTLSGARRVSGRMSATRGGYYGGDRFSLGGSVTGRVNHHVLFGLSANHNRIELPGQGATSADVYGANVDVFFSTRLQTSAFVQYNEASQEVVTNLRFRWIHAPLSDLFLVFTERRDRDAGSVLDRFVTLKFTKLLAF